MSRMLGRAVAMAPSETLLSRAASVAAPRSPGASTGASTDPPSAEESPARARSAAPSGAALSALVAASVVLSGSEQPATVKRTSRTVSFRTGALVRFISGWPQHELYQAQT